MNTSCNALHTREMEVSPLQLTRYCALCLRSPLDTLHTKQCLEGRNPRLAFMAARGVWDAHSRHLLTNIPRRHVILPHDVAKLTPKGRLLTETEWRQIGVQQSRGWEHYAIHK